jgi:hypothetical protein
MSETNTAAELPTQFNPAEVETALYQEWLDARPGVKSLVFIVVTGGVLGLAWLRNRKATKEVLQ